ncbi:NAD(P)H-dependent glycerol-3-phosphate dehydrogenase [Gorillibacterium massiliense]|uniref:NAD(P)H-dependent glycerol-3-phosphate dehydrogenase n=1 Tax=Gorillibacterium massiliense TaxID=1280390 RepID=UPI0004BB76B1|nr:NAD(P)H-dependent glycerol-3-phosphate dehydrogenase [Gorillibacterium massiliense]
MHQKKTALLVAGSWGTAIATVLADNGHDVVIWTRRQDQADEININHTNAKYLPDVRLSERIRATSSMEEAVTGADAVVLAATSSSMREVAALVKPYLDERTLIIHATKGFEAETLKQMTEVIAEEIPQTDRKRIVVLSGPSHAEEVVLRCPTTTVVAAEDVSAAEAAQDLLMNSYFRVYTNPDVTGVEVGGALKNIIALGVGMSDGLGFGDNAKAALMTRGLTEIVRLGIAMGANPLTFSGLAGLGDLIVTCTSKHSRNWRAGYMLGQGASLTDVLDKMQMVVEGVKTTSAASKLAETYKVRMPITNALYGVLFAGKRPKEAVEELMGRLKTHEIEEVAQNAASNWLG